MQHESAVPQTKRVHFMTTEYAHDNMCRGQIQSVANNLSIIETFGVFVFPLSDTDVSTMEKKLSAVMVADVSCGIRAAAIHQMNRLCDIKNRYSLS